MEEFEIKFLEIDVPELERKLLQIGAEKVGEFNYARTTFDYPDFRLDNKQAWVRLRTDGRETSLTYKERVGVKSNDGSIADDGMKEIEVVVDSYEKTCEIIKSMGFIVKGQQKNKRVRYMKNDVVFDIDSWPFIPPYLEIESTSLEKAKNAAKELDFNLEQSLMCSTHQVYKKYGFDVNDYSSITFGGMIKK